MHRSRRSYSRVFVDGPALDEIDGPQILPTPAAAIKAKGSTGRPRNASISEVMLFAEQALCVTPRLLAPGQFIELDEPLAAGTPVDPSSGYRVTATESGDALVIQRKLHAEVSPFSGLLVRRARAGWPPRVLFDMEPLVEGSADVVEAVRMLSMVVQHASAR